MSVLTESISSQETSSNEMQLNDKQSEFYENVIYSRIRTVGSSERFRPIKKKFGRRGRQPLNSNKPLAKTVRLDYIKY